MDPDMSYGIYMTMEERHLMEEYSDSITYMKILHECTKSQHGNYFGESIVLQIPHFDALSFLIATQCGKGKLPIDVDVGRGTDLYSKMCTMCYDLTITANPHLRHSKNI